MAALKNKTISIMSMQSIYDFSPNERGSMLAIRKCTLVSDGKLRPAYINAVNKGRASVSRIQSLVLDSVSHHAGTGRCAYREFFSGFALPEKYDGCLVGFRFGSRPPQKAGRVFRHPAQIRNMQNGIIAFSQAPLLDSWRWRDADVVEATARTLRKPPAYRL